MTHLTVADIEAALDVFDQAYKMCNYTCACEDHIKEHHAKTIRQALRLAAKVLGEPSMNMKQAGGDKIDGYTNAIAMNDAKIVFEAMINMALKEIENAPAPTMD